MSEMIGMTGSLVCLEIAGKSLSLTEVDIVISVAKISYQLGVVEIYFSCDHWWGLLRVYPNWCAHETDPDIKYLPLQFILSRGEGNTSHAQVLISEEEVVVPVADVLVPGTAEKIKVYLPLSHPSDKAHLN